MKYLEDEIRELEREIDFLFMYPQGSMSVIQRKQKELKLLKSELK